MKPSVIHNEIIFKTGIIMLILLWSYAGLSKILDQGEFAKQIALLFPAELVTTIFIAIPTLEIIAALALAFKRTNTIGLILSLLLITVFTLYVLLVISGYFGSVPCSCGGIISALSWKEHLILNILFLFLVIYLLFAYKLRKEVAVTK
ncbi:hypothetical protein ASU31_00270 [Pedobacter ginsenosidimutans]|uniref:Methylamine utilisation protein MauE domain-containing protein n=1 Tax=Pedobacter ginsenosidimutans TaxID=687842 RepID=A0A0T5VVC4_9SPHI|nr:MauE/DoxX family redox-associated membrane protein [Pedobacter ginsenosidimutans]KRT17768.1 hypothetical protein ASU31_00270 [Pedobacter ginsenosidimutans]